MIDDSNFIHVPPLPFALRREAGQVDPFIFDEEKDET